MLKRIFGILGILFVTPALLFTLLLSIIGIVEKIVSMAMVGVWLFALSFLSLFFIKKHCFTNTCIHCGAKLKFKAYICVNCGCILDEKKYEEAQTTTKKSGRRQSKKELQGKKESFEYYMRIGKELSQDYIECASVINPCPKCAPYRYRLYSISGNDKRFPKFSDYITVPEEYCCLHFYTRYCFRHEKITVYTFTKTGKIKEKYVDAIKSSNRPFVYDVPKFEILYAQKGKNL